MNLWKRLLNRRPHHGQNLPIPTETAVPHVKSSSSNITSSNSSANISTPSPSYQQQHTTPLTSIISTPSGSFSGQEPQVVDELHLEISSPDIRILPQVQAGLYFAKAYIRPLFMTENDINEIIERLETDLLVTRRKIAAKGRRNTSESELFPDVRMSGWLTPGSTTTVTLTPSIWLFCGSKWCRKLVEDAVQQLTWIREHRVHYVEDREFWLVASFTHDDGFETAEKDEDDDEEEEEDNKTDAKDKRRADHLDDVDPPSLSEDFDILQSNDLTTPDHVYDQDDLPGPSSRPWAAYGLSPETKRSSLRPSDKESTYDGDEGPSYMTTALYKNSLTQLPSSNLKRLEHSVPDEWDDESSASDLSRISTPSASSGSTAPPVYNFDNVNTMINNQRPANQRYRLPCEFGPQFGCQAHFAGDEGEQWIAHTEAHLHSSFPVKLHCWYRCDFKVFDARHPMMCGDRRRNFRSRMLHIREHILDGDQPEQRVMDENVLKHLRNREIIKEDSYQRLVRAFVRPVIHGPTRDTTQDASIILGSGMELDLHIASLNHGSAIGLICRSSLRRGQILVARWYSRMGGVCAITRGGRTELFGITTGHSLLSQLHELAAETLHHIPVDGSSIINNPSDLTDSLALMAREARDRNSQSKSSYGVQVMASPQGDIRWTNVSHEIAATYLGIKIEYHFGARKASITGINEIFELQSAGDLALFQIPRTLGWIQNDYFSTAGPQPSFHLGSLPVGAVIESQKVIVLFGKSKAVVASTIPGRFGFSIGGRRLDVTRIRVSQNFSTSAHPCNPVRYTSEVYH